MVPFAVIPMHIYNPTAYLGNKTYAIRSNYSYEWYVSFEDALWDLLEHLHIPTGSVILVPSFYCVDVMNNINAHGYVTATYEITPDLKVNMADFNEVRIKAKPKVIIALHIQGLKSELLSLTNTDNVIFIEDSVHRLENPSELLIQSKNHFIITSLRKVSPFTGSFIVGEKEVLAWRPKLRFGSTLYAYSTLLLHYIFQAMLTLGYKFTSSGLLLMAENVLRIHNDLIGDSHYSGTIARTHMSWYLSLNFDYIFKTKQKQIAIYLSRLHKASRTYLIPSIPIGDFPFLRGVPIIVPEAISRELLVYLRENEVYCKYQLDDCEWSKNQKLLLLPIGPHITNEHILQLCMLLNEFEPK